MTEYNKKYKLLVKYILENGILQDCRNGSQLIITFYNFYLDFSYKDNHILHLRKINYSQVYGEFKTLIDKNNKLQNINQFKDNKCYYWDKWAKNDGSINLDYYNMLHPQLELIIDQIKRFPNSRRHIIELWNYKNVFNNELNFPKHKERNLSLPCCWHNITFSIINNKLFMSFTIRSNDIMIGNPADVYLAYLFHKYVAIATGYKQAICNFNIRNAHIYKEHIDNAKILLTRTEKDIKNPLFFKLKK